MDDVINRQAAIDTINELHDKPNAWLDLAVDTLENMPSAQPTEASCWGCNCPKMEMNEQKTFSEMVHLHDAETHSCDLISKAMVFEILADIYPTDGEKIVAVKDIDEAYEKILQLPSAQPEIIHCLECVYGDQDCDGWWYCRSFGCQVGDEDGSGFCSDAERNNNV